MQTAVEARLCLLKWSYSSSWGDFSHKPLLPSPPPPTPPTPPARCARTRESKLRWHHRTLKRDSERPSQRTVKLSCLRTLPSVAWNPQHQPPAELHQPPRDWPSRGSGVRVRWGEDFGEGYNGGRRRRRRKKGLQCSSSPHRQANMSRSEWINPLGGDRVQPLACLMS